MQGNALTKGKQNEITEINLNKSEHEFESSAFFDNKVYSHSDV